MYSIFINIFIKFTDIYNILIYKYFYQIIYFIYFKINLLILSNR